MIPIPKHRIEKINFIITVLLLLLKLVLKDQTIKLGGAREDFN